MKENNLTLIPKVEPGPLSKDMIEWEIPGKISMCFMLTESAGLLFVVKVSVERKHWWNSSQKTFTTSSIDPAEAFINVSNFLEQHGYCIDIDTLKLD